MTDTVTLLRAIASECKRRGLAVTSVPGWETRGLGPLEPTHCHVHHTAAERDVTALLLQGRPGIRGPLCNLELRKDGTVVLIAARRANHAGVGTIPSSRSIGIEATGPIPISAQGTRAYPQYTAYIQLCAAIRTVTGWPADRVVGHKETATPPGRKVDPAFDMTAFRAAVSQELATAATTATALHTDGGLMAKLTDADKTDLIDAVKRGVSAALTIAGQTSSKDTFGILVDELKGMRADLKGMRADLAAITQPEPGNQAEQHLGRGQ